MDQSSKLLLNFNFSDMILKDSWTSLVGRNKGSLLRDKLKTRIKSSDKIISLDFSNVSCTDVSFAADFLLPLLKEYKKDKLIVGINVKKGVLCEREAWKKEGLSDIDDLLKDKKEHFLIIDDEGDLKLLGSEDAISSSILNLFMRNNRLTSDQICLEMDEDQKIIKQNLAYLVKMNYLQMKKSLEKGYQYYEATYLEEIRPYIGNNLEKNIEEKYKEIIEERHIELPSGVHTDKLYHVSTLLRDPRLTKKIGIYFADLLGDHAEFVLTLGSANNIVLSHRIAQAIGVNTRSIFSTSCESKKLCLHEGFEIKEGEYGIVFVDVVVTGFTIKLLTDLVKRKEGVVSGIGSVFDLSGGGGISFPPHTYRSLIRLDSNIYDKDNCPQCQNKVEVFKPKIMPGGWDKW